MFARSINSLRNPCTILYRLNALLIKPVLWVQLCVFKCTHIALQSQHKCTHTHRVFTCTMNAICNSNTARLERCKNGQYEIVHFAEQQLYITISSNCFCHISICLTSAFVLYQRLSYISICLTSALVLHQHLSYISVCLTSAFVLHQHLSYISVCLTSAFVLHQHLS